MRENVFLMLFMLGAASAVVLFDLEIVKTEGLLLD